MPEQSVTKCLGLVTVNNPFSAREGALILANNCVVRRTDIAENVRGYENYAALTGLPENLLNYSQKIITHTSDDQVWFDNGAGTLNYYDGLYEEVEDQVTTGNITLDSTTVSGIADIIDIKT